MKTNNNNNNNMNLHNDHPEVKEVLRVAKDALRFLHDAYGMDFTKPFLTATIEGSFTANKIISALQKKYSLIFNLKNYAFGIFFRDRVDLSGYDYMDICSLEDDGDTFEYKDILHETGVRTGRWLDRYVLDSYTRKAFDEKRKSSKVAYIFAQRREFVSLPYKKKLDITERVKLLNKTNCIDGVGNEWISQFTVKQGNSKFDYKLNCYASCKIKRLGTEINNYIDKSGFFKLESKNDYAERVTRLKLERERSQVDRMDFSKDIYRFTFEIEILKEKMIKIISENKVETLDRVSHKYFRIIQLYNEFKERATNKSFGTLGIANTYINSIRKLIEDANEIIDGYSSLSS